MNKRRDYEIVPNEKRYKFLQLVEQGDLSIKKAADRCGIKYENAKVIVRNYRALGIIDRRKKRDNQ